VSFHAENRAAGSLVYLTSPCALLRNFANRAGSDRAKSENYARNWAAGRKRL